MKGKGLLFLGLSLFGFIGSFADTTNGLVAYYPFEGNADDASGNGWHGSNYSGLVQYGPLSTSPPGLWPVAGKRGQAAWFDGNSSIKLPQPRLLDGESNAAITVWVWFNDASLPVSSGQILSTYDGFHTQPIATRFDPDNHKAADVRFAQVPNAQPATLIGFGGDEIFSGIVYGKWLMITLVLEQVDTEVVFRAYLDTDLIKEAHSPGFSRILYPNDIRALVGDRFKGVADELRIYNRTLKRSDILELFYDGDPNMKIEVSTVRVCWFTPTNKTAQLQYRSTLTSNSWLDLGPAISGMGTRTCIADAVEGPQRFYRVVYLP
jgi:hypothetical protein